MGHGVGFVAHEHALARTAVQLWMAFGIFKRKADYALHALPGVDVFLYRDLIGRALLEYTARVGVNAFGVFTDHDEVNVLRLDALERAQCGIEQAHRTHVGVEIHFEAHAQQDLFGMNVRSDTRIAESAHQDGIEVALQHREAVGRDGDTVDQIAVGAPVKLGSFNVGTGRSNDLDGLEDDFFSNAVTGNNGDSFS